MFPEKEHPAKHSNRVIGFSVLKVWSLRHQGIEECPQELPLPKPPKRLERSPKLRKGQNQEYKEESLVIRESLRMHMEFGPISLGWESRVKTSGQGWGAWLVLMETQ